jgi:truncated hemoglobin YjbI
MTRLLYERHVPADDLLAPLFATMLPGYPQDEAAVMAGAFGGPGPVGSGPVGSGPVGSGPVVSGPVVSGTSAPRPDLAEPQRARWVVLALRAADEAMLPADPQFRAALTSYLEWSSRSAGAAPPPWDWGPAGPPVPAPAPAATQQPPVTLPGPNETVTFEAHIKPLFREHDRKSMTFAFDLWSRDDVQAHAAGILARLRDGTMPCDGAWPPEQIEVFQRWTETGCS